MTVPRPGLYHIYADAVPHGYGHQVFRFDVPFGAATMKRDALDRLRGARVARAGPYEVALDRSSVLAGKPASIAVTVTENGRPASDLHPYLGGLAHAVFVNASDLAYVHVHPMPPGSMAGMSRMSGMSGMSAMDSGMTMESLPDSAHVGPRMDLRVALTRAGTYVLWFQFRGAGGIDVARFVISART